MSGRRPIEGWVILCAVLLVASCHSPRSSSTPVLDATTGEPDGAANECTMEGYVCLPTPGCGPGYQVIDDLFCTPSTDYCCEPGGPDAGADVGVDVGIADVHTVDAPSDGPVESGAPETGPFDAAEEGDGSGPVDSGSDARGTGDASDASDASDAADGESAG
jgi:hypothetical protein